MLLTKNNPDICFPYLIQMFETKIISGKAELILRSKLLFFKRSGEELVKIHSGTKVYAFPCLCVVIDLE